MIEIILVIAIIAILSTIIALPFSSFRQNQALQNTANTITATLEEARTKTIAGVNNSNYSVRFESSQIILFQGTTYSSSTSSNLYFPFETPITLGSVTLNGGGSQISFNRLTGTTNQYGTISLVLPSSTRSVVITVASTGTVSRN